MKTHKYRLKNRRSRQARTKRRQQRRQIGGEITVNASHIGSFVQLRSGTVFKVEAVTEHNVTMTYYEKIEEKYKETTNRLEFGKSALAESKPKIINIDSVLIIKLTNANREKIARNKAERNNALRKAQEARGRAERERAERERAEYERLRAERERAERKKIEEAEKREAENEKRRMMVKNAKIRSEAEYQEGLRKYKIGDYYFKEEPGHGGVTNRNKIEITHYAYVIEPDIIVLGQNIDKDVEPLEVGTKVKYQVMDPEPPYLYSPHDGIIKGYAYYTQRGLISEEAIDKLSPKSNGSSSSAYRY